jgi:hypothetical protein
MRRTLDGLLALTDKALALNTHAAPVQADWRERQDTIPDGHFKFPHLWPP